MQAQSRILSKTEFVAAKLRLRHRGVLGVRIVSGSMSPLIRVGERIEVRKKSSPELFDVVVYHHPDGQLICHYVWGRSRFDRSAYLLRPLKGAGVDLPVRAGQILGYVPGKQITGWRKSLILWALLWQRMLRKGLFAMVALKISWV